MVKDAVAPSWPMVTCRVAMGDEGLERPMNSPSNTTIGPRGGAKSGAIEKNPDLALVIAAWSSLPQADRAAIMLRVRAAAGTHPTSASS